MSRASPDLIRDLKERLRQMERSCRPAGERTFSTGITALDRLLPDGGLKNGTLIEWLSDGEGTGAATLALLIAAETLKQGGALVVVDERGEFYPPAAAGITIALEQMVVVRPRGAREALWSVEQALRSRAAAVVLSWAGRLNDRVFRRWQLAAETGGGVGFLLRPLTCRGEPSWAEARLLVEALPASAPAQGRRLRVVLLHGRGKAGSEVELELSDETGDVRVVSRLAVAKAPPRAAGA
jgi:protein ImuA